ncbi:peroxiredoxin [Patescibacteria group bacterium]|nr:peroxiredoxin [Patescibacteria group bacterium]
MPTLHTGESAPSFSLLDEKGATVALQDFKGQFGVVLVFYPGDMTPGCTLQLCSIRDEWSAFEQAGLKVFGVNPATSKSHQRFKESYKLPFPLLIDADKSVAESYDSLFSFFGIRLIRRTVIGIDKTGTIRYIKRGMPRPHDILKAMQKHLTSRS